MSTTPCIFEIDATTSEATGTVMPFCSDECREAFTQEGERPYTVCANGVTELDSFGYEVHCEQCNKTIPGQEQNASNPLGDHPKPPSS